MELGPAAVERELYTREQPFCRRQRRHWLEKSTAQMKGTTQAAKTTFFAAGNEDAGLKKAPQATFFQSKETARAGASPAPDVTVTVAPFRAWRGWRLIVAEKPTRAAIELSGHGDYPATAFWDG